MRIMVTGGDGHIGSHFVCQALEGGHTPIVYDILSMGHRWAVAEEGRLYEADLADAAAIKDFLRGRMGEQSGQ